MSKIRGILLTTLLLQMVMVSPCWSIEVGRAMPDFGITTLAGESFSRASLAGKPVMLVFWNTWCPYCKRELPRIDGLAQKYAPKGLAILAINTGQNDSESKARAYWQQGGFVFPTAFDRNFSVGESFRIQGVPEILLVDARGVVRYQSPGIPENIEERIRQLTIK